MSLSDYFLRRSFAGSFEENVTVEERVWHVAKGDGVERDITTMGSSAKFGDDVLVVPRAMLLQQHNNFDYKFHCATTKMSPSRGQVTVASTSESTTEAKADVQSSSALKSAKRNLHYLFDPANPNAPRPAHLRTRALLRSLRYIGIFVFWRIVRYAKYALVGSIVAAIGASAFGGVVSGAAIFLAPPTLLTSIGIGAIWAMGKWGFRKMRVGEMAAVEVQDSKNKTKVDGTWRDIQGPKATPW